MRPTSLRLHGAQLRQRAAATSGAASGTREIASAAGKLAKRVGKLRALICRNVRNRDGLRRPADRQNGSQLFRR